MKLVSGVIGLVLLTMAAEAGVVTWNRPSTHGVGPFDFNTAGNWNPAQVPGAGDIALFTNVSDTAKLTWSASKATDSARFDLAPNLLRVRFDTGSYRWTITNEMILGYSGGVPGTSSVTILGGTVAVTNAEHTAKVIVGGERRSRIYLQAGAQLITDHLYATNAYIAWGIDIDNGTLTTLGDSVVDTNATGTQYMPIGVYTGVGEWDMLGGTNIIRPEVRLGWHLYGGGFGGVVTGKLVVANPGTECQTRWSISTGCDTQCVGVVVVSNGATLRTGAGSVSSAGVNIGSYRDSSRSSGTYNLFLVNGPGSKFYDGYQFYVGWSAVGNDNTLRIENGGTMIKTNSGAMYIGIGQYSLNNQVIVDGPGSLLTDFGDICVGGAHSQGDYGDGKLIVTNGGAVRTTRYSNIYCGNRPNAYGEILVTGPGSTLAMSGLWVGSNAHATVNGRGVVTIADGGMLDAAMTVGRNFMGTITNNGGVFQFGTRAGGITCITPNTIVITNGTIAYRDITDAYIYGNQPGAQVTSLTNVVFQGNNAFRLNNASNATWGSDYVFDTGRGATNYTRLELVNNSTYRGGTVTIGSGGTLVVSNGMSAVGSNLTFQSGGTFAVHVTTNAGTSASLAVGGTTIALGGATLKVTLGGAPVEGQYYPILTLPGTAPLAGLGAFSSPSAEATYGGKTYTMVVRYAAGDGNDVAVSLATKGTLMILR